MMISRKHVQIVMPSFKFLFFVLLMGSSVMAQKVEKTTALPLDPMVRTGKLANGFTYYIRKNQEPANRVVMYLAVKAGSVLEEDNQQGLAHFMEHMSFNGTKHFPKNELVSYLQKSGVRFGADLNAYTSFEETVYQLPLPTDKPEILENGIQIMRDWAQDASLDPEEIDRERGVILEEKRLRLGVEKRMQDVYFPMVVNNSRYAYRLPIGTEEVLKNFKPETIRKFYQEWYRPGLQALIVVGDINPATIEQKIRQTFADLKEPANARRRTEYSVPLTGKNQFMTVTDREMTGTVAQVIIKHPGFALRTKDDYRAAIVRSLFNRLMSFRFSELANSPSPAFLKASAEITGFLGNASSFSATAVARPGELEKAFKSVWSEVIRVRQHGFTSAELARSKKDYMVMMESMLKEKDKTASDKYVQEYLQLFLREEAAPGIQLEYELVKELLPGISLQDISSLANKYISEQNRDVLILAPDNQKSLLPSESTFKSWLSEVSLTNLVAWKDESKSGPLIPNLPPNGKITSESVNEKLGTQTLFLSNGIKVILKPTDFKNDQVLFTGVSRGGTSLYSDADFQSAANAAGIIASSGLGDFGPADLPKILSGRQVQVKPFIGERNEGISGAATPGDLETALQLVHLYFTAPRKDAAVFANIIDQSKNGLLNRANDPSSVFSDTIAAVLGRYNVRRTGPGTEKLEQINLEKAFSVFKERFANAGDFTFVFTGSFDNTSIRPLIEKYLGSLPSGGPAEEARDLGITTPEGVITKQVFKGNEDKATVRIVLSGSYVYNEKNNVRLSALKEILEFHLLERLREAEGGVYTPSVALSTSKSPRQRFALHVSFGCAPARANDLIAATMDEVRKLGKLGPTDDDLKKFVAEEKSQIETQLRTNNFWQNYLVAKEYEREDPGSIFQINTLLDNLSLTDIQKAASTYLNGKNVISFILLPEK